MPPAEKGVPAAGRQAGSSVRLDLNRIRSAVSCIAPVFRNTPQYVCPPLGEALDCEIILKLETANPIRCFKGRGTETVMARLADGSSSKGAVCASAGNLGQALAYSGQSRGISTTVVAGANANPYKLERIRALGATVRIVDGDIEDARQLARQIADSDGAFLVEDSENIDTCEGAGTIGLELLEGIGTLDAVLIALGGGAMATGVGYVFKCLSSTGRNRRRATKGGASDGIVMAGANRRRDGPNRYNCGWSCRPASDPRGSRRPFGCG